MLQALNDRGRLDNTIVIVTSDHGESFKEHGYYLHGHSLYLEQIKVPLILNWRNKIPAGQSVSRPVSNASLPATIADLTTGSENSFPAPSLVDLWQGATAADWPDPQAATPKKNWAPPGSPAERGSLQCVIDEKYHLIVHELLPPELYQWASDPNEVHDLAESPAVAPLLQGLMSRIIGQKFRRSFEK